MKYSNPNLATRLASVLFLVYGSSGFATRPVTFAGSCDVFINGKTVLTNPFTLDMDSKPCEFIDINVPNCDGVYTKFRAQVRLISTANDRAVADIRLTSKGKPVSSSYTYGAERGTSFTFSSKLLDNSFVTCSTHVR